MPWGSAGISYTYHYMVTQGKVCKPSPSSTCLLPLWHAALPSLNIRASSPCLLALAPAAMEILATLVYKVVQQTFTLQAPPGLCTLVQPSQALHHSSPKPHIAWQVLSLLRSPLASGSSSHGNFSYISI